MKNKLLLLFVLISVYTYGQTFPTNDLAGYYKFDSGNVLIDQSGASNFIQTGSNLTEITDRFDTASTNAVSLLVLVTQHLQITVCEIFLNRNDLL
jgi:hypothetical protein